jgi:hypothetical protein
MLPKKQDRPAAELAAVRGGLEALRAELARLALPSLLASVHAELQRLRAALSALARSNATDRPPGPASTASVLRVEVRVLVSGRNGTMGLSRRVRLPFIPFPGLELVGITAEPGRCETVASVAWDARRRCFRAELLDRVEPEEGLAELIDSYGPTWGLREPGLRAGEEDL